MRSSDEPPEFLLPLLGAVLGGEEAVKILKRPLDGASRDLDLECMVRAKLGNEIFGLNCEQDQLTFLKKHFVACKNQRTSFVGMTNYSG